MNTQANADGRLVRRYDYEDRSIVAADLGATDGTVHVDTIEERALVVVEREADEEEFELELPGPATSVETTNGVLTITVER